MTKTPVAPDDRYVVERHGIVGCAVHDRVLGISVGRSGLTWGAAHSEAQRLNREARAANNPPPAPCPHALCARYRAALEEISRISGERNVLVIVNAVLGVPESDDAA